MSNTKEKPQCTHLATCPMFNMFESEISGRVFKTLYCHGNWQTCHRYQRSESGQSVPANMLPNGKVLS
jgi:hypothetical protein